jgi:hypothetical protein
VYFPTTAVVSLLRTTSEGRASEVAQTGSEGVVGVNLFLGRDHLDSCALCADATGIKAEFARAGALQAGILDYVVTLMAGMALNASCNRHHVLLQQVSRWLLHSLDRAIGMELQITQEQIAHLLGVRREGVTVTVRKLQALGLLRCSRGRIQVMDRAGLERLACECYRVLSHEHGRALGGRSHYRRNLPSSSRPGRPALRPHA